MLINPDEVVTGALVNAITVVARQISKAAAGTRKTDDDLSTARWSETFRLTDPPPDLPELSPTSQERLAAALSGDEIQAALQELLAVRLTDASENDATRARDAFGMALGTVDADLAAFAETLADYYDDQICALVARLEGQEPPLLAQIRSEAFSSRIVNVLHAIERQTASLAEDVRLRNDNRTAGRRVDDGLADVRVGGAPVGPPLTDVADPFALEMHRPVRADDPPPGLPVYVTREHDWRGAVATDYLAGLPAHQQAKLVEVNGPGLAVLREYLSSGQAVAFLGAGVSSPLYPLWDELIGELLDVAAARLPENQAEACRVLARESPEEMVEIIRQQLGVASYREALRQVLRPRVDPESGRSWTPVHELVCRCAFKAVVTTNYDPGIVDARMRVRPGVSATGFTVWDDELGLDQWRTGDVFGEAELPVLFAHGQHNRPDSVVLATTEYRRAYAGKLPRVLARLLDEHLVWIGFSFADQRIAAILRQVADRTGTPVNPGGAPRHIAVIAWDWAREAYDPGMLARRDEIAYGANVVLYPAADGDHSALGRLLAQLTDDRFLPVDERPVPAALVTRPDEPVVTSAVPMQWVPKAEPVEHFTGRLEQLARLDRWAADPQVKLIGVTAWGGAGKTTLVTQWVQRGGGRTRRPGIRGVFAWSFYADPSADHWARALLEWAQRDLSLTLNKTGRAADEVLALLRAVPLVLVMDGLERVQEGPAGQGFGQLLDGILREVLTHACQIPHDGLIVLTSRFPFTDLETFDGGTARMMEVPPFTPAEGAELLAAGSVNRLTDPERRDLAQAVDGHALAVSVLTGLLTAGLPALDLAALRDELTAAARTDARVNRVLQFYAERLNEPDRYLLAALSLFARPEPAAAILTAFADRLPGWTPATAEAAIRNRLDGLASWYPDGTISAHPLIRDTFGPLVLDAAPAAAETMLTGVPAGTVTSTDDALRMVEAIELLVDAGQWQAADGLSLARSGSRGSMAWVVLPAARLGQRAATAFVGTPARREACAAQLGPHRLNSYLHGVGLWAMNAGDMVTAREYLQMAVDDCDAGDSIGMSRRLRNLSECLKHLGDIGLGQAAAAEALACAQTAGDQNEIRSSRVYVAWLAASAGDTARAEQQFILADQIEIASGSQASHLYSLRGAWWADFLARTKRSNSARALTSRNREICLENGWSSVTAWCDRQLGRLALAEGDNAGAGQYLTASARCFRDGDYLTELSITLADLAEHARAIENFQAAERLVAEAINIASTRGLVATQSAALTTRARIRAAQATTATNPDLILQGRDAADAALRIATRHQLPWCELDADRAQALLDRTEGVDGGWAGKADKLQHRLIPLGLDPDPLGSVERLVTADQKDIGG